LPEVFAATTVAGALSAAADRLAQAGCEAPRLDAEVLLAFAMRVGRDRLVVDADAVVSPSVADRFAGLLDRRAAREPVAYITGVRAFRRITLAVDRRVLIPRPETELLVEVGISLDEGARVVDVGTGSGAVALALKDERPDLSVVASELDPEAVEVARQNAARLGLEVQVVESDLLPCGHWDAVLANLPYVADDTALPPEIALYEPRSALFAGPDGLSIVRRLLRAVSDVPLVALEVGFDQAPEVSRLLGGAGFASVERLPDLAGHERVVVGRR
jgi:release factor glutamine methyltransferase